MKLTGKRTLVYGLACLVAMVIGFKLVPPEARGAAFAFYVVGIGTLMGALAGKASIDSLSGGGGIEGAKAALMTSAKPGEPPEPKP